MTIKSLYPASRPALGIDFAKTKRLDPRVAFTRVMTGASVATFVGADGLIKTAGNNVPRFDHNPTTGESLGLLVEEARTNSLPYSQGFTTGWHTARAQVVTGQPDPVGGTNAILVKQTNGTSTRQYISSLNATYIASNFTVSVFVKYVNYDYVILSGADEDSGSTGDRFGYLLPKLRFQFSTKTILLAESTWPGTSTSTINYGFQEYSNGWYRLWLTRNTAVRTNYWGIAVQSNPYVSVSDLDFVTGDNSSSVLVFGFQVEQGAFPTSYIPTSGATVTRSADVATLSNANSSIFPTSAFTTVNTPFGTAGGGSTVKLVGPTIKRTAIYDGNLPQAQINTLTNTGDFWRWRVLGNTFALPTFTTNGSVTVDWGDGVVETLTTAVHTFTNGGGYHDIGFRLNSGTFFKPNINNNATYKDRVIAVGPAPASMKADASAAFYNCTALRSFDATVDTSITTNLSNAWLNCSSLVSFPLINTASVTNFVNAWNGCSNLTSFPLINTASATSLASAWSACSGITFFPLISTAAVTNFDGTWNGCSGLTSFPLINTAAGTNFLAAWGQCSNLTSFPLINTAAGTNFQSAWNQCSNLTSFPLINTAAGTNFTNAWLGCNKLTSFPLINTGSGTTFFQAWAYCSSLTSFPLINTAAGTNFQNAWGGCTGLTSFPLINTAAGTNFLLAWYGCSSLTSFPLINMAAGTSFGETWRGCTGLTSFPAITFNSATNLNAAWYGCTNLATFPANAFNTTGTLVATAFGNTFLACALTSTSIENILTSLVTNGQSNITLGLNGGTNAGAATWTANAIAAYNTLISRGWTITRNA
jgi:hypothetical protein